MDKSPVYGFYRQYKIEDITSRIDYNHCDQALQGAYQVLERANIASVEQDYVLAVDLLLAIMADLVTL